MLFRHRLECRVRGYRFVRVIAYKLFAMLQYRLRKAYPKTEASEGADALLQGLARVERVQIKLGNRVKYCIST